MAQVDLQIRRLRVHGRTLIRVWLPPSTELIHAGPYRLSGLFSLTAKPKNRSPFDPEATALRQGIIGELSPHSLEPLTQAESSLPFGMLALAERCRQWVATQVTAGIEDDAMATTLISTMALGTSGGVDPELEKPFRDSGTIHIFAVSGLHIGLLAIIGWTFLGMARISRGKAALILIPLVFGYAFITGWVPSAARAALMSGAMIIAPVLNRTSRMGNSLGLAAIVLLATDTLQLFQAGFQLSFGVLAAIAIMARPLARPFERLTELDAFLPPSLASQSQLSWVWIKRHFLSTLSTSVAAWIGSMPLLLYHFQSCTPVSIIANVVLVPLSFVALFTVSLSLLAALCQLGFISIWLNNANWVIAHLMLLSAHGFAAIPGGHFTLSTETFRAKPVARLSILSMPPGESAHLLRSGNQLWMLDCGSDPSVRRHVAPFLRTENVNHLDGIVLSHSDVGHLGGAKDIIDNYGPTPAWVGLHEPWKFDSHATYMWQLTLTDGDKIKKLQAGDHLRIGLATLQVLYPSPSDKHDKADDRALVVRIEVGETKVLWCSDAGFATEKALLQRLSPEALRSHVLIRSQHATDWSALPEFIMAVAPRLVISSNSPGIAEERIPDHLRQTCQRLEIPLRDLNQTGMIDLDLESDRLTARSWLTKESLVIPSQMLQSLTPRPSQPESSVPISSD
jgi:ComEC/Rec2-related protein